MLLKAGTIVDATIINAPPSTKNAAHARDPEMRQTKKGNQCAKQAGVRYRVNRRAKPKQPLTDHQQAVNQSRAKVRARGEHAFQVVKHLWGHTKVRYRGLAKNLAHTFTLFALANLYRLRRRLLPPQASCAP